GEGRRRCGRRRSPTKGSSDGGEAWRRGGRRKTPPDRFQIWGSIVLSHCFTGGLGFARSFFAEPMWCTNEVGGMVKGQGQPGGDQEFARCFFAEQVMRYVLRSGIDGEGIRGCTGEVE
uniref:Uncharacterized protein n=1 Tax=Aegilops tauschii subsp. strangulata TaxID=200361 RepID=A0A453I8A5_AEGTS